MYGVLCHSIQAAFMILSLVEDV